MDRERTDWKLQRLHCCIRALLSLPHEQLPIARRPAVVLVRSEAPCS